MSAFGSLDTGFPMFNDKMNTEQKLKAVEDYLVQMLEQLRYTLNNLGAENFNEQSMNDIAKVISKPIIAEINDPENGLAARITANEQAIQTEVSKSGTGSLTPGETLYSRINQTADSITAAVNGADADEWETGHAYVDGDVVKVKTASGDMATVLFYKCLADHTSSASTKPGSGSGWSSKWVEVTAPNVQSMISANLEGVSLSYDPDHSGVGTNEVYLTLNKDGVQMGGGKVKIDNLDAGTITAGTISADYISGGRLDAGTITLDGAFSVSSMDALNWKSGETYSVDDYVRHQEVISSSATHTSYTVKYYRCVLANTSSSSNEPPNETYWERVSKEDLPGINIGSLGGTYDGESEDAEIDLVSQNEDSIVYAANAFAGVSNLASPGVRVIEVRDNKAEIYCGSTGSGYVRFDVYDDEVKITRKKDNVTKTYNLLDLLDQIQ